MTTMIPSKLLPIILLLPMVTMSDDSFAPTPSPTVTLTDISLAKGQQDGGYPRYGAFVYWMVVAGQTLSLVAKLRLSHNKGKLFSLKSVSMLSTIAGLFMLDSVGYDTFVGENLFLYNAYQDGQPVSILASTEELAAQPVCFRFTTDIVEDVNSTCFEKIEGYHECEVQHSENSDTTPNTTVADSCEGKLWGCTDFLNNSVDAFSNCQFKEYASSTKKSCMQEVVNLNYKSSAVNFFNNLYATNLLPKCAYAAGLFLDLALVWCQNKDYDSVKQAQKIAVNGLVFGVTMSVISLTFENGCFATFIPDFMSLPDYISFQRWILAIMSCFMFVLFFVLYNKKLREFAKWPILIGFGFLLDFFASYLSGVRGVRSTRKNKQTWASMTFMIFGFNMDCYIAYLERN